MKNIYGNNWKDVNKLFKLSKQYLICEVCGDNAKVVHHILDNRIWSIRKYIKHRDNCYYFMILCSNCHWFTKICIQPFEFNKVIEYCDETGEKAYFSNRIYSGELKKFI